MFIPEGLGTITPYFFVDDADGFVEFLVGAFGGTEAGRSVRDGKIANAQVRIGSTTLMVSEASENYPAMRASHYLYVENADDSMKRAIEHGAKLEMEVFDMQYGDRQGGVVDAWGNIWWISQRLVDEPYSF